MYQYPYLLLTEDDARNAAIADLIEDDLLETCKLKKELYNRIPDGHPVKQLYDVLEVQVIMDKMLCDIFRSHMTILNHNLSEISTWKVKDRLKKTLTIIRLKSADILHNYDGYTFGDTLRKLDRWEDAPVFNDREPREWNATFLNRISDIHRHMYRLSIVLEDVLLLHNQPLKPSTNVDKYDHTTNINSLGKILEACRFIHREVKDYINLVDSL